MLASSALCRDFLIRQNSCGVVCDQKCRRCGLGFLVLSSIPFAKLAQVLRRDPGLSGPVHQKTILLIQFFGAVISHCSSLSCCCGKGSRASNSCSSNNCSSSNTCCTSLRRCWLEGHEFSRRVHRKTLMCVLHLRAVTSCGQRDDRKETMFQQHRGLQDYRRGTAQDRPDLASSQGGCRNRLSTTVRGWHFVPICHKLPEVRSLLPWQLEDNTNVKLTTGSDRANDVRTRKSLSSGEVELYSSDCGLARMLGVVSTLREMRGPERGCAVGASGGLEARRDQQVVGAGGRSVEINQMRKDRQEHECQRLVLYASPRPSRCAIT